MRRALVNSVVAAAPAAAALSLLFCAATVMLWIRSYGHLDDVGLYPTGRLYWLARSAEGRIYLQQARTDESVFANRHTQYTSGELSRLRYENLPFDWRIAGVAYGRHTFAYGGVTFNYRFCMLPHAVPAALFAMAPALWLRAALRRCRARARRAAGRCAACGYDLRASPARCPECGAAGIPAADAAPGSVAPANVSGESAMMPSPQPDT